MRIELLDLDVPYEVSTDINAAGTPFVRLSSNLSQRNADYDICLDRDGIKQLIRTLQFIAGEL